MAYIVADYIVPIDVPLLWPKQSVLTPTKPSLRRPIVTPLRVRQVVWAELDIGDVSNTSLKI